MQTITVKPNASAIAIQSPKPPKIPMPTLFGLTDSDIINVITAEPVPKILRKMFQAIQQ